MKKLVALIAVVMFAWGCHSDNDMHYKDKEVDETLSENPVGIQNNNGNIPDTINTIDIGNYNTTDSISVGEDSLKYQDSGK